MARIHDAVASLISDLQGKETQLIQQLARVQLRLQRMQGLQTKLADLSPGEIQALSFLVDKEP